MSFIYSQELGEAYWQGTASVTLSSERSSVSHTVSRFYKQDSETEPCHRSPSGETLQHSTGDLGVDAWILSARASRVSRFQSREDSGLVRIQEMDGPPPFESFGKFDQSGCCLRTYQVSLLAPTVTCTPYSDSWPRAGMIVNGTAYLRTPTEPLTKETGSGSLPIKPTKRWPTPLAHMAKEGGYPSEGRRNEPSLSYQAGGILNPDWVELLMGWPKGWTSLEPLPPGTIELWLESESYWPPDWEDGTPRTGKKHNNSARLKAIGNGQVPICAIMAWNL